MSNIKDINYVLEGKKIHVREHIMGNPDEYGQKHCAYSIEKIKEGDECYLIMTNYSLFPNCWLSKKSADEFGIDECLFEIYNKYKIYEPLQKIFG